MQKYQAIFYILDTPAFGGAEQYMFSHLYFLSKQRYTIILATNNEKVKKEMLSRLKENEKKNFIIIDAPFRLDPIGNWKGLVKYFIALPKSLVWGYQTLRRIDKQYDRVIYLLPGYSIFSIFARIFHHPLIWIEFGTLETIFKRNFGFPKLLFSFLSQYATCLITSSLYTKASIVKNSRFKESDIHLVYPGTQLFSLQERDKFRKKGILWKKREYVTTSTLIGVIARLAHENEIEMVIHAFALYLNKNSHKNIYLLIMGDGPQRQELEDLTRKLHLEKYVKFFGFISEDEKRIILSACDFFIFPRAWVLDGFGMTTIEAMSLGLPILTTDFGPQIEIVTNGKEGYRYKPHDPHDLAVHIAKMVDTKNVILQAMKKESLKRAKDFSDDLSNKRMFEIIESL